MTLPYITSLAKDTITQSEKALKRMVHGSAKTLSKHKVKWKERIAEQVQMGQEIVQQTQEKLAGA